MKKIFKIVSINLFFTVFLFGLFLLIPPITYLFYQLLKSDNNTFIISDDRSKLDIYNEYEWADIHFKEFNTLNTKYYDFITWRRNDYKGSTINIENGLRRTNNYKVKKNVESKYWFFGGSTTWGTGVNDELTYPSLFAKNTNHYVTNFGESGYIARQSLAYMINYITQNNLKNISDTHVVFYDGVNDVSHRCRSEIKGIATSREKQIQNSLSVQERFNFSKTFEQLIDFFSLIQIKLFKKEYKKNNSHNYYNCSNNNQRAYEIAETLVNTWEIASDYVISKGGKFTAILQPVSFYGKAQFDYLNLNNENDLNLASQYNKVYPLIINIAKKRNFNFVDLTSTYDGCSVCYIDFGHVGPQGHEILVKKLLKILN